MIAGLLNEIITIYHPTTTTNEYGEEVTEYKKTYTTRAKVDHKGGGRAIENNEIIYDYSKTFNVRSYVPVCNNDIIMLQSKRYRILSTDHRREYNDIIINAELINE